MATRLYIRASATGLGGYSIAEKSTALPVGTLVDDSALVRDLSTTKGAAQTSTGKSGLAQTAHQDIYADKWISPTLGVSQIDANTWTLALATGESNTNMNAFTVGSIYVLKSDDTVRGYVYDSDTALGVEYAATEDGQVFTVSGSAVTGVVSTDRLAWEFWVHAVQAMAATYTATLYFDGTTDVTDTTTTDAASYIETPQNNLFAAAAALAPPERIYKQAVNRAAVY